MSRIKRKNEKATPIEPKKDTTLQEQDPVEWDTYTLALKDNEDFERIFPVAIDLLTALSNRPFSQIDSTLSRINSEELDKFFNTLDLKHFINAIRENLDSLHDKRVHALVELCQGFKSLRSKLGMPQGRSIVTQPFEDWSKEIFKAINKGLDEPKGKPGRSRKIPLVDLNLTLANKWEVFRDKGMKALKPRYRDSNKERLDELISFLKSNQFDFPRQCDEEALKKINYMHKREARLKLVLGYCEKLIDIPTNSPPSDPKAYLQHRKEIKRQLNNSLKKINRILQFSKHELDIKETL